MHRLALLIIVGMAVTCGCQTLGQPAGPPYPQAPQDYGYQPEYNQTYPPQVQGPPPQPFGKKAGRFLGDMAGGFVRSAVGGAGFTAGRDLWNTIIH